jgi:hypothetical protein
MVQLQHLDEVVSQNTVENKTETNAEIVIDNIDEVDEQMVVEYLEEIPPECERMEKEEMKEPILTNYGQYECQVCEKSCAKYSSLVAHMKSKHGQSLKKRKVS